VKLQAGEYVSLGKVEAEIKTSPLVENICVYAESSKHFCVALVVANEKALQSLASSLGISGDFEKLCSDETVEKAFIKELSAHALKCRLERFEIPQRITLCKDSWSPANGLLTAAFKIKRNDIQKKYKAEIEKMYK
jgi:long-chain acyl-CoA synthetase